MKKGGSKENVPLWGSGGSLRLYRSRSMDFLPQKEHTGTKALCALFESKASPQPSLDSSPPLHSTAAAGWKTRGERPLPAGGGHSNPTTQVEYIFYKATTQRPDFMTLIMIPACVSAFLPGAKKDKPVMCGVFNHYIIPNQEPASMKKNLTQRIHTFHFI